MIDRPDTSIGYMRPLSQESYMVFLEPQKITEELIETLALHCSSWKINAAANGMYYLQDQNFAQLTPLLRRAAVLGLKILPISREQFNQRYMYEMRDSADDKPYYSLGVSSKQLYHSNDDGHTWAPFLPKIAINPAATPTNSLSEPVSHIAGEVLYSQQYQKPLLLLYPDIFKLADNSIYNDLRDIAGKFEVIYLPYDSQNKSFTSQISSGFSINNLHSITTAEWGKEVNDSSRVEALVWGSNIGFSSDNGIDPIAVQPRTPNRQNRNDVLLKKAL